MDDYNDSNHHTTNGNLDDSLTEWNNHIKKLYRKEWTPAEVEKFRRKTNAAKARAKKILADWELT